MRMEANKSFAEIQKVEINMVCEATRDIVALVVQLATVQMIINTLWLMWECTAKGMYAFRTIKRSIPTGAMMICSLCHALRSIWGLTASLMNR